jgi:hypothetical protein
MAQGGRAYKLSAFIDDAHEARNIGAARVFVE